MQVNPTLELTINCFLWYVSYSAFGWVMETLIFAIRDKKSCKRGFLFGPLCPIYGTQRSVNGIGAVFNDLTAE